MILEFSRQIFEKYSSVKFHEIPSTERSFILYGRKDKHDEAYCRFSPFCKGAYSSGYMVFI